MSPTSYRCSTPRCGGSWWERGGSAPAPAYCPAGLPPEYRRRWGVSRPCSGWERVGPPRPRHRGRIPRAARAVACAVQSVSSAGGRPWVGVGAGSAAAAGGRPAGGRRALGHRYRSAAPVAGLARAARRPCGLQGALLARSDGGARLGARFALRCRQRLSRPDVGYPAVPLARQPVHRRSVRPGPLVLGAGLLSPPTPATDRDRTVSRRSEPSSRAALMGEQPNPWDLLRPRDATSRHRGAKPCRRCGLSGKISLLSPG